MSGGIMDFTKRDQIWIVAAKEAFRAQQIAREAEKSKDQAFKVLRELTAETPSKGGGFVYSYSTRKGSIDYEKVVSTFLNLSEKDMEPFRKAESKAWKLEMQLMDV